jgi:hypothetical protein
MYCFHHQGQIGNETVRKKQVTRRAPLDCLLGFSLTLKIEAIPFSKTSVYRK